MIEPLVVQSTRRSPIVGIVMGSDSDWPTMRAAADVLASFDVPFEARVMSAHRTPHRMAEYGAGAYGRGLRVLIAGAGGAAHLPGMLAAYTLIPVIGVPVAIGNLQGIDALLSIVQMPRGVPVATVAIGNAQNAGLLAAQILATSDSELFDRLVSSRVARESQVLEADARVRLEASEL